MAPKKIKNDWVDFKEIKSRVGLKDILAHYGLLEGLKQKNDELSGPCPFHKETKGSFCANLAKNAFHCFGCKAHGNILNFVSLKEGVDIRKAALLIQQWFEISPEGAQERAREGETVKKGEPPSELKKEGNEGVSEEMSLVNPPLAFSLKNLDTEHPYLFERDLTEETIEEFRIGYCSRGLFKDWVVIPVHNENGELVAYAGRWPSEDPPEGKYKLPPQFQKSLIVFNLHRAKELAGGNGLVLVEDFFDCFKLWQAGLKNVVALMGTSMSPEQEELIVQSVGKNGRVVLLFDGDKSGHDCTDQAMARLGSRIFVKAIKLNDGVQPDKLTKEDINNLLG